MAVLVTSRNEAHPLEAHTVVDVVHDFRAPTEGVFDGAERVVVAVSDALVAEGWFATSGWEELVERHRTGTVSLLVVQVGLAPCAAVPADVPLIHEKHASTALSSGSPGEVRPPVMEGADLHEWEQLAARVEGGEPYDSVRDALGLTDGTHGGSFLDGRFRLLRVGDSDALFTRWEAEDRDRGCLAVVSILHPHVAAMGDETLAACAGWAKLKHPGLAELFASGRLTDGRAWFAREWIGPVKLADVVGQWSTDALLLAVLDVEDGLQFAHESGVVHAGVEPERVRLRANGSAALVDFGLASLPSAAPNVVFAAPESMEPGAPVVIAHDIYGMGMLVLQALHGQPLPYWVLRDAGRLLEQVEPPPALGGVLKACLDWDAGARPQGLSPLRKALLADTARLRSLIDEALARGRDPLAEELVGELANWGGTESAVKDYRHRIVRMRVARGNPEDAVEALSRLALEAEDPAPLWLEIAGVQHDHGLPGAIGSWENALNAHRTRDQAVAALRGLTEVDTERFLKWGRALALYAADAERGPLAWRLGRAFHLAGDEPSALLWLDRAADAGVDAPELLALREELRTARGDWADVVELMRRQADAEASDAPEILERAARLARRATPDPAPVADLYARLVAVSPEHAEARRQLARFALRDGDVAGALEHLGVLCASDGATPADHTSRARLQMESGECEWALAAARDALEIQPHHAVALRVARRAAQELGEFDAAIGYQDRLLELEGTSEGMGQADRLVRLGNLKRFKGDEDGAIDAYDRAIAMVRHHHGAWWGLYVIERNRLGDPVGPPAPLRFGPHEALARLLAEVLEMGSVRSALSYDVYGTALGMSVDWDRPSSWAAALVDFLSYRGAVGPFFFESLLSAFPTRSPHIAAVRNLWSGAAHHTASFPVADSLGWSDDGPDFAPELQRELVYFQSWPGEGPPLHDALMPALLQRSEPLPEIAEEDDGEDLLLEAPEIPVLRLGGGDLHVSVPIEISTAITRSTYPQLPGDLHVSKHGDRIYVQAVDGELVRDGFAAREFRLMGDDVLYFGDVPLSLGREEAGGFLELDEPDEETAEVTDPRGDVVLDAILPRPAEELDGEGAGLFWKEGDAQLGVSLERPLVAMVERQDGGLVFHSESKEAAIAEIAQRGGQHFIEQELTNATGFGGRLSARALANDEVVMIGSVAFLYRASKHVASLDMPKPSLSTARPTLLLDDGSLIPQPVPVTASLFRLGRGRQCELQIRTDKMLSRVHCQVREIDGTFYLEDAGSSNGTRLNSEPIEGLTKLVDGDLIEIGHTSLNFTLSPPVRALSVPQVDEPAPEPDLDDEEGDGLATLVFDPAVLERAIKAANGAFTEEECSEKVRMANRAFRVLFTALDDCEGAGRGRSELQLLLDSHQPDYGGILEGIELEEPSLSSAFLYSAITKRPETERRAVLNRMLLELIDEATDRVCELLPEEEVDGVLSRMAAIGHRKALRL